MVRSITTLFRYLVHIFFIISMIAVIIVIVYLGSYMIRYEFGRWLLISLGSIIGTIMAFGMIYVILDIALTLQNIEKIQSLAHGIHPQAPAHQPYPQQYPQSYQQPQTGVPRARR